MRRLVSYGALGSAILVLSVSAAHAVDLRYAYMLPKTLIDANISYTFKGCQENDGFAKIAITPTLTPRAVPDLFVHQRVFDISFFESAKVTDRNISLATYSGSRILSSIGSQPTNQTGQIISNILTGATKLLAVGLGTASAQSEGSAEISVCTKTKAYELSKDVEAKQASINGWQELLAQGVNEAGSKQLNAQIAAAQALIAADQEKLTLTVKATLDPGITSADKEIEGSTDPTSLDTSTRAKLARSGVVAHLCPSSEQLGKWFDSKFTGLSKKSAVSACDKFPSLDVGIYFDLAAAHSTPWDENGHLKNPNQTEFLATQLGPGEVYRDVAYIPVEVWKAKDKARKCNPNPENDKTDSCQFQTELLASPQIMPFGQFGVGQALPFDAPIFKSYTWSITFLENGEITKADFTGKASLVPATSSFQTAASAANSIATEMRNASSVSANATALQAQADYIYQSHRLDLCQTSPATCPRQ